MGQRKNSGALPSASSSSHSGMLNGGGQCTAAASSRLRLRVEAAHYTGHLQDDMHRIKKASHELSSQNPRALGPCLARCSVRWCPRMPRASPSSGSAGSHATQSAYSDTWNLRSGFKDEGATPGAAAPQH